MEIDSREPLKSLKQGSGIVEVPKSDSIQIHFSLLKEEIWLIMPTFKTKDR